MAEENTTRGIKETQEFLEGWHALGLFIIKEKKAGRFSGNVALAIPGLLTDALASGITGKLQDAINGIGEMSAECKDLDLDEMDALTEQMRKDVFDILRAIRGENK